MEEHKHFTTYTNKTTCQCAVYERYGKKEKIVCHKHSETGQTERIPLED